MCLPCLSPLFSLSLNLPVLFLKPCDPACKVTSKFLQLSKAALSGEHVCERCNNTNYQHQHSTLSIYPQQPRDLNYKIRSKMQENRFCFSLSTIWTGMYKNKWILTTYSDFRFEAQVCVQLKQKAFSPFLLNESKINDGKIIKWPKCGKITTVIYIHFFDLEEFFCTFRNKNN